MNAQIPDRLDVGLSLLDRQIIDCNDRQVANVDDLAVLTLALRVRGLRGPLES